MRVIPDPYFYVWANDADRVDAFLAALSALVEPGGLCEVDLFTVGVRDSLRLYKIPVDELITLVRTKFTTKSEVEVHFPVLKRSGVRTNFFMRCRSAALRGSAFVEHFAAHGGYTYICPHWIEIASPDGKRSIAVEATILSPTDYSAIK